MERQTTLAKRKIQYSRGAYNKVKGNMQAIRITEGCPNNCPYCNEPTEFKIFGIPEIVKNKVLIYDMNLIAKPEAIQILKDLSEKKVNEKVVYYEFVCGIDYRFMTQEIAYILHRSRFGAFNSKGEWYRSVRIAWDWSYKEQYKIKNTIDMLIKAGYKSEEIMIFIICNWKIPYDECCNKLDLCKIWGVKVSDCYFDNQTFPNVQPEHWTYKQCKNFRKKVRKHNQLVRFKIDPKC